MGYTWQIEGTGLFPFLAKTLKKKKRFERNKIFQLESQELKECENMQQHSRDFNTFLEIGT